MKQVLISIAALLAASLSAQAETISLKSCAAIDHPVERLACYDMLAGRLPAETAKAPEKAVPAPDTQATGDVPAATVVVPAAPAPTPTVEPTPDAEAIFGLEHKQKPKEERPDELQLKWTKKRKDAYGKWIVTLENGQVWRQTDSTRFSFKNSEQWVIIARGAVGGFFLGEPERNKRIRVKRVK